jgi:hypothetical protein
MFITESITKLSTTGIVNVLSNYSHVRLFNDESREELEQILQLNLNDGLIDEIDVIIELSGE